MINYKKKIEMPVVILAGGLGTRLKEETEFRPKPMVEIGGKPILWHIMKTYAYYGFYRFIICLGYKGNLIKDYFLNYRQWTDFTINTRSGLVIEHSSYQDEWEVSLIDTGQLTQTGGRIALIKEYIDTSDFMLTYGDGVADVNVLKVLEFHKNHNKIATVTSVKTPLRFGNLSIKDGKVDCFLEKQSMNQQWINGGFFIVKKDFFSYCPFRENLILEKDVLPKIVQDGQLMAYQHEGFWHCMDTIRDHDYLENLWKINPPWKVWNDNNASITHNLPIGLHYENSCDRI